MGDATTNLAHACGVSPLFLRCHCLLKVDLQFQHDVQQCVDLLVVHRIVLLNYAQTLCLALQVIKQLQFLLNFVDLEPFLHPDGLWDKKELCQVCSFRDRLLN